MTKQPTTKNKSTKKMAKRSLPEEKKEYSQRTINLHILRFLITSTVKSLSKQKPELAARLDRWVAASFRPSPGVNVDDLRRGEMSMWAYVAAILVSIAESAGTTPLPQPNRNGMVLTGE
jgi:hypothetical protein